MIRYYLITAGATGRDEYYTRDIIIIINSIAQPRRLHQRRAAESKAYRFAFVTTARRATLPRL